MSKRTQLVWLVLILFTAVLLRTHHLTSLPPGLTHDEADHGITAQAILDGEFAAYFTIGYGREPLYDYATALMMVGLGENYLAGRLTAVFFSILSLALLFALTKTMFDTPTALLATAGMAVSFWAVMTGRQSLRSVTLPFFFMAAAVPFLWVVLRNWGLETGGWGLGIGDRGSGIGGRRLTAEHRPLNTFYRLLPFIVTGLFFGLSLYTYIPARVLWVVVLVVLVYLLLFASGVMGRVWLGSFVTLGVMGLVGLPLFRYLAVNPTAEVRIQELRAPLTAVQQGNWQPLIENGLSSLRLFFIEGDSAWRYNIAGKPWLSWWLAGFFLLGLGVVVWWAIRPFRTSADAARRQGLVAWFLLAWFAVGFAPVFVTGPELSTTQAIGMQPTLFIFVAIGLRGIGGWGLGARDWGSGIGDRGSTVQSSKAKAHNSKLIAYSLQLTAIALFGLTAVLTYRDYLRWGAHPEVRVQYESGMVAVMDYVNVNGLAGQTAVSTITPHQFHTPALAAMTLDGAKQPRWFNASGSLLIPNVPQSTIILSGFAPLHEGLAGYFETAVYQTTLPQPETDLDQPLTVYQVTFNDIKADWADDFTPVWERVLFSDALSLHGVDISVEEAAAGDVVQLATLWQLRKPINEETRLFTHMLGADGVPLAQQDRLDAPADSWRAGDWLIQLHSFEIPAETAVGNYPLVVGAYTCPTICENGQRLPVLVKDAPAGTAYPIGEIIVTDEQ